MNWPTLAIGLMVTVLFAGCLQGTDESNGNGTGTELAPVEAPLTLTMDAGPCQALTVAAMVEPSRAYQSLPPGFRPRDANGLFETGAPTGKVPIFIAALDCPEGTNDLGDGKYQLGLVAVFVEAPSVQGHASNSNYDFYLVHTYTDNEVLRNALRDLQWQHESGSVAVQLNPQRAGQNNTGGTASIEDGQGQVASMIAGAVVPVPAQVGDNDVGFKDWSINFWHQNDAGIGYLTYEFSEDVPIGPASCSMRYDSPPAIAVGQSDCPQGVHDNLYEEEVLPEDDPYVEPTGDSTVSAIFRDLMVTAEMVWFPGKVAQ